MHRSLLVLAASAALILLPGCYVGWRGHHTSGYVGVPGPVVTSPVVYHEPVYRPAPVVVHHHHRRHRRHYARPGCYR